MKLGKTFAEERADDGFSWPAAMAVIGLGLMTALAAFHQGLAGMLHQWSTSSAYNHAFLILPISLYLIWERRADLAALRPDPSFRGIGLVLASGVAWLAANSLGIDEGVHFAILGILQGLLLTALGAKVYRLLLFPLSYLWLMVPTGGFLVAPLQTVTAVLSTALLKLSAIPVYTEGWTIEVPSGTYFVARGCAGLNFLLASLALALVYGYLVYARPWKRVVAVAAMLSVAILGNAVRVWGIIALAHLTDNRIDIVDDHLLYGWGFFSLLLLGMMALGSRFRDEPSAAAPPLFSPGAARPVLPRLAAAVGL
ncbi:MAG: exosortase, partial [Rhodospirillales bacterium]|nr:exosortase [Rhodospirillales bacterium]